MNQPEVLAKQVYTRWKDSDRYAIEITLHQYEDIFNEWDSAPFKRRDIDHELEEFLLECSSDITLSHPLALIFYTPRSEADIVKEEQAIKGLQNYFAFSIHVLRKHIRQTHRKAIDYTFVSALFLIVAIVLDKFFSDGLLGSLGSQGLFIGGWVFLWETMSLLVFQNGKVRHRIKEWERFLDAPIEFRNEVKP